MKIATFVIVNKWVSFLVIGGLGPLVSGLGQWIDTGEWPPKLNWVVIIAGCFIGMATQNLAFLSQSFGNYKAEMESVANSAPDAPDKPKVP